MWTIDCTNNNSDCMGVNEKTNPINLSINIPESQIEKPVVFKWLYIGDEIPANSKIVKIHWDESAVLCLVPYEAVEKTAIDTPLTEKVVLEDVWDINKSTEGQPSGEISREIYNDGQVFALNQLKTKLEGLGFAPNDYVLTWIYNYKKNIGHK